jgi:hypothetical protein
VTAGHLLVAAVGAQGLGTLSVEDSAGDSWTSLPVQSNTFLSLAGCDYEDWAQIFYTTSIAGGPNTVTMSTTGPATYLALAVGEYTSSGSPLLYDTNVGQIASLDASTNVQGPGSLTTNGCTDLLFVFYADELPSDTTWAPSTGLTQIALNTGWAWDARRRSHDSPRKAHAVRDLHIDRLVLGLGGGRVQDPLSERQAPSKTANTIEAQLSGLAAHPIPQLHSSSDRPIVDTTTSTPSVSP